MTVTIERAAMSHLPAIPRIEQAAAAVFPEADLPLHIRYRVTDRATLATAQREGRLWVALDARRRPVGFAHACFVDGQAHLDEMDVHPEYLRRGIGTRLLNTVVDWATAQGYRALTLVTFRHLPWNAPFYAALGFREVDDELLGDEMRDLLRQESEAGLKAADRVCMRRALA